MPKQQLKQRPDGRYACNYKGIRFYGNTQKEALAKRDAYKRDEEAGMQRSNAELTFVEYALKVMPILYSQSSRKVYNDYIVKLEKMAAPIGHIPMGKLTQTDVKSAYDAVAGMSGSYLRKCAMVMRKICSAAYMDGACKRDPAKELDRPKGKDGSHRALTQEEIKMVTAAATHHRFGDAAMVMLYAGLRRGEMLALNIDRDVDFAKKEIHVMEAVTYDGNAAILDNGKTENAQRVIPLLPPLEKQLSGKHGLVLPGPDGSHASQTVCREQFDGFLRMMECELNGCQQKRWYGRRKEDKAKIAAGEVLPPWKTVDIRMHDFRHTFCVMLFDAGVDMKTAQMWMGHADATMIMRIYDHLSKEREKGAKKAVEKLVENLCKGQNEGQKLQASP